MSEPVDWPEAEDGAAGAPRSPRFGDTYFSSEDGLAETRAVFLDGCGLPEAWAGRRRFTVAELGFGTGLNILALLDLWRRARPSPGARLHLFSVEAYPMGRADAERALAHWPELADLVEPLLEGWPDGRRGFRRIEWPGLGATLDLAVLEVAEALDAWTGQADAWFLDGFAPARNPEMWRDEVLALVAARSAPGARAASFTVAGAVRRGLEAQGFAVERRPGFGRKKQRLEAVKPGACALPPLPRVAILGAGIAGASLRRAFDRLGVAAQVFDAVGTGAGASGNPAALVTPWLDAGLGPGAALHAAAFARATRLYRRETPDAVIAEGVLQLETQPRDTARFERIAGWDGFAEAALEPLTAARTAGRLDEAAGPGALAFKGGLVLEPAVVLSHWLCSVEKARASALERQERGWRVLDEKGRPLAEADLVVVALGHASIGLVKGLALAPVRGQASLAGIGFTGAPAAWGGYAIPTRTGLLFGATHDRRDTATDVRAEDHARNLALLGQGRPALAAAVERAVQEGLGLAGRAAIRAATPDHLPLAGPAPGLDGVFVLAGLGGRGFTLAPLLAEALAAEALGVGGPLPAEAYARLRPGRFAARD